MARRAPERSTQPAFRARAVARHDVLEKATEIMLSLIRLHVISCPDCADVVCSGGMRELLQRVDDELGVAAAAVAKKYRLPNRPARRDPPRDPRGKRTRPTARGARRRRGHA